MALICESDQPLAFHQVGMHSRFRVMTIRRIVVPSSRRRNMRRTRSARSWSISNVPPTFLVPIFFRPIILSHPGIFSVTISPDFARSLAILQLIKAFLRLYSFSSYARLMDAMDMIRSPRLQPFAYSLPLSIRQTRVMPRLMSPRKSSAATVTSSRDSLEKSSIRKYAPSGIRPAFTSFRKDPSTPLTLWMPEPLLPISRRTYAESSTHPRSPHHSVAAACCCSMPFPD